MQSEEVSCASPLFSVARHSSALLPLHVARRLCSRAVSEDAACVSLSHAAFGCSYIPDTEEYLAEIGHWWEDETEPDLEHEVSLASEFSDLDVDGSGLADREGTSVADIDNEDDNADDETAQLGRYFGAED